MKKSPTDILKKEHDIVLKILNKIEKGIRDKNLKLLQKEISILEKEFDRHSLTKEEKILFPELEKFIPREGGPTGMMIHEHNELVNLIKEFKSAIRIKDFQKLSDAGNSILSILRPHIDKENNILFMISHMHLSDKQKEKILEKFKKIN